MLIKPFLGEMSGKLAGLIFGHGRSGSTVKRWRVPTNPNTEFQQAVRNAMSSLVIRWGDLLTADQRETWENYALNVPVTNRMGETIHLTGQQHFIRSNVPKIQNVKPMAIAAPAVYNLGLVGAISISITAVATIDVTFEDTLDWADEDNSFMILQESYPQNPTKNFFKGPFNLYDTIDGSSVAAPASPYASTSIFNYANGQKAFVRARISRADGRLSSPQIVNTVAVI